MARLLTICLCFICFQSKGQSTKEFKSNYADTFYNVIVPDPYRSLEDTGNLKVKAWMRSESDKAKTTLKSMPGYYKLYKQYKQIINKSKFEVIQSIFRMKNEWYALKAYPGQNNPMLYQYNKSGKETLIMDPEKMYSNLGSKNISMDIMGVSPHNHFFAYSVIIGGNEFQPLLIIDDLKTRRKDIDAIFKDGKRYFLCFDNTNDSILYYGYAPHKNEGNPIHWFDSTITYRHKIGQSSNQDEIIIEGLSEKISKKIEEEVDINLPVHSNWAIATIKNKVSKELRIYITPIKTLSPKSIRRKVCDFKDEISNYVIKDDEIFMLTYKNSPLFKVISSDLTQPEIAFKTVLPEQNFVLDDMKASSESVLLTGLSDKGGRLISIPFKTKKKIEMKLPLSGEVIINYASIDCTDFIFTINSWTKTSQTFIYKCISNSIVNSPIRKYPIIGSNELVVKEVKVPGHDGVLIPVTLIYKKGMEHKAKYVGLGAYGAYGSQDHPNFFPEDILRYNMGYFKAVAHVRGGGIYGEDWHKAGMMGTKSNTWKDVISCAEYLINKRYATNKNLIVSGGSAGGITAGRSISERPDLFAGAIISVGALDMVGFERSPNGKGNTTEFGSIKTKSGFENLYNMSTYQHIKVGVNYPPVIFFHGVNDNRVPVYNSLKTYARMKDANISGKPILLDLNYDSGHGQETNTSVVSRIADQQSFIYWILGIPEFQPK